MINDPFPKQQVEALWAPWRVEYFEAEHKSRPDFLLEAARSSDDAEHLVVAREKHGFLIMNKYPYAAGHLMAVPNRKVADPADLDDAEALELFRLCSYAQRLLTAVMKPHGFNVGYNLGKAGGAGCDDHLHLHIVPRWNGDSNFIAVLGGTRIIPEGLQPMYQKLHAAHSQLGFPS